MKGYAQSAPFAMGKFALRGLAQSHGARAGAEGHPRRAFRHRRRHPQRAPATRARATGPTRLLDPDAIARELPRTCCKQPRSAWTWELELRPWVEKF